MTDLYPSRREAAPRILPRLDPVVHSSWDERAPITRAQAEQFDRDGYLVLDNVFSAEEVAALQTSAAKLLADPAALERSEERRVGKECVSTCRSRWSPYH